MQQLEAWAKTWGMRFNAKKCYLMSINQKSTHFYQFDGHILQQVPDNPYLSVTLSDDLKWSSHINKANYTLGFLKRNFKHCPQDSYPYLEELPTSHSSDPLSSTAPLFKIPTFKRLLLKRRVTRFITGDYTSREQCCVSQLFRKLKLPSLKDRRKANRLVFFFKGT